MSLRSLLLKAIILLHASLFSISSPASRIVVIADVHADLQRFKSILRDASILDMNDKWIAEPNTLVIQLGDQIDPKANDDIDDKHHFKMIYFTNSLQKLATTNNGQFISLIGNHELYNIAKIKDKHYLRDIIAHRPVILQSNKYIFCHGGFKKLHYYMLDIYNKTLDDVNNIWTKYVYDIPLTMTEDILLNYLILDTENSILFTRLPDTKEDADKLCNLLDINYMFVGHTTVQSITLKNKVWFLDIYLKDAFDKQIYSYIVIKDDAIEVKQLDVYADPFTLLDL
jgi:hypothetical protein